MALSSPDLSRARRVGSAYEMLLGVRDEAGAARVSRGTANVGTQNTARDPYGAPGALKGKERPVDRSAKPAKAKVEAKLSVSRKAPKNEGARVRDLEKRLAEALEQETATAAVLRVISSSPTNVQPVFDAIAASAVRLCGARIATVFHFDGEFIHLIAHHGYTPEALELRRGLFPAPPHAGSVTGRAILNRAVVHVADALADGTYPYRDFARAAEVRSVIAVPMLRDERPIGAVTVSRAEPGAFAERQIELLKTFANQAVIAIENVRLFTELQEKNRAFTEAHAQTSEALEQQTATAEILRVIASSPTDLQGVLDTVAASAARLCDSVDAQIFRVDGTMLRLAASYGELPKTTSADARPISRGSVNGRAVVDRQTIHVRDLAAESDAEFPIGKAYQKRFGHRTLVATPLLREGTPIGAITIRRMEVRSFSEKEIKLLETFANQAVIAIENVRLFTELQASNRELTEALERQTATADILRIIGTSPTDVQPIFDAIVRSASRLCDGEYAILTRYDGELLHLVAQYNPRPGAADETARLFPQVPRRETAVSARALLDAAIIHLPDVETEEFEPAAREYFDRIRLRAVVAVPMIHEGRSIGVVSVCRGTPGPFSRSQVDLLRTFADQAVIAIENTRLFSELQEKNKALTQAHAQVTETLEQQTATSEILRVISNSPSDLQPVFDTIVRNAVELCGAAFGGWHRLDSGSITLDAQYGVPADELAILQRDVFPLPISRDSATGRAMLDRAVVHIRDIRDDPGFRTPRLKTMQSYRTILAVPMIREGIPIGAVRSSRSVNRRSTSSRPSPTKRSSP
jgi:two-component system NtrC family sensor kinase